MVCEARGCDRRPFSKRRFVFLRRKNSNFVRLRSFTATARAEGVGVDFPSRRQGFWEGRPGKPALPCILLAGNRSRRGDDSLLAISQGTATDSSRNWIARRSRRVLTVRTKQSAPAIPPDWLALRRPVTCGKKMGRPLLPRTAANPSDVFSEHQLFRCRTQPRCILYAQWSRQSSFPARRIPERLRSIPPFFGLHRQLLCLLDSTALPCSLTSPGRNFARISPP